LRPSAARAGCQEFPYIRKVPGLLTVIAWTSKEAPDGCIATVLNRRDADEYLHWDIYGGRGVSPDLGRTSERRGHPPQAPEVQCSPRSVSATDIVMLRVRYSGDHLRLAGELGIQFPGEKSVAKVRDRQPSLYASAEISEAMTTTTHREPIGGVQAKRAKLLNPDAVAWRIFRTVRSLTFDQPGRQPGTLNAPAFRGGCAVSAHALLASAVLPEVLASAHSSGGTLHERILVGLHCCFRRI
jgi:hypothetical protein